MFGSRKACIIGPWLLLIMLVLDNAVGLPVVTEKTTTDKNEHAKDSDVEQLEVSD